MTFMNQLKQWIGKKDSGSVQADSCSLTEKQTLLPSHTVLCLCPSWGVELPPISLGLLYSQFLANGYELAIRDLNLEVWDILDRGEFWDKSNLHFWINPKLYATELFPLLDPLLEKISDELSYGPWQRIAFSVMSTNIAFTNQLVQRIKLKVPDKIIIAGGPALAFAMERSRLRTDYDFYCIGEGEGMFLELIEYLDCKRKSLPSGVSQIRDLESRVSFRMSVGITKYEVPQFRQLLLHKYTENALPVIFSRSCLFKCRFCADHPSMGSFRKLSAKEIFSTLDSYYQQGYRRFWFNDLLINGIMKELVEVFGQFLQMKRHVTWIALATPNRQLEDKDLIFLHSGGLQTLNLGVESGSNRVMRLMKKGFDRFQAIEGMKRIHQAGINTQLNIIVGFPGETEKDFEETLGFLDEIKPFLSGFTSVNSCVLLPGSEIANHPHKYGIHIPDGCDFQTEWYAEESTPQIRKKRLHRVLAWVEQNGYSLYSSNKNT